MLDRIPFRHPLIGDASGENAFTNRPNTATVNTAALRIRQAPTKGCCRRSGYRSHMYYGIPHVAIGGSHFNAFNTLKREPGRRHEVHGEKQRQDYDTHCRATGYRAGSFQGNRGPTSPPSHAIAAIRGRAITRQTIPSTATARRPTQPRKQAPNTSRVVALDPMSERRLPMYAVTHPTMKGEARNSPRP